MIRWIIHDKSLGVYLAEASRSYFRSELENFDIFLYQEDDMIISHSHLIAYLYETKVLHGLLGELESRRYMIGFQRFKMFTHYNMGDNGTARHQPFDLFHQEFMEETPFLEPICLNG